MAAKWLVVTSTPFVSIVDAFGIVNSHCVGDWHNAAARVVFVKPDGQSHKHLSSGIKQTVLLGRSRVSYKDKFASSIIELVYWLRDGSVSQAAKSPHMGDVRSRARPHFFWGFVV
jgi:hypothetical protein